MGNTLLTAISIAVSDPNSLHLVEVHIIVAPVVQPRRSRLLAYSDFHCCIRSQFSPPRRGSHHRRACRTAPSFSITCLPRFPLLYQIPILSTRSRFTSSSRLSYSPVVLDYLLTAISIAVSDPNSLHQIG